jgi:hypothetical protein
MRTRVHASILVVLAITALLAGCGSSGSSSVSPAAYVKAICSAVGPFERDVRTRSSALNLSTIRDAGQGKQALQGFLNAVVVDTDAAVTKLKAAGTPSVSNGQKISSALVGAFGQLRSALHQAASNAGSLPTTSPQAFKTAAQSLGNTVKTSMSSIGSSLNGLRSPDLEKAAANEPSCKTLATG